MSKMSKSDAMIEAQREMCAELEEQRLLLEDIKRILVTAVDGHNEHRSHVADGMNRLGQRTHNVERRVEALEKIAGRDAE